MAMENERNVFSSPWDDSDIILVVEDQELHVHKWILTSQSPVFKAMLDGRFMEASQDEIILNDKDPEVMVEFLKLLYPWSMFEDKVNFDDENFLLVLALADEYQCVKLIKQCIEKVKITSHNVLQILPYAVAYHQTILPKVYDVIKCSVSTAKLETVLPSVEDKETSDTMLLTKCRFLETRVVKMKDALLSLLCDFLRQGKELENTKMSLKNTEKPLADARNLLQRLGHIAAIGSRVGMQNPSYPGLDAMLKTTADHRCPHSIGVREIKKTKGCLNCKEKYKQKFLASIPSCRESEDTQNYFDMLKSVDDVATAVSAVNDQE
ncbi:uncharacterized protein LOC114522110 [Dendronephthya gigantea]|uniref:uncharacterized protein LOC114522110 n=1 Tax=Dendronephthya gigantea TaxID=151771 RepID=UPI00106DA47F|nr:uncharacterized protein LOC114522110 [Dendronephthya gigantea]